MSNSGAWGITAERLIDAAAPPTRVVNMNHLGRALHRVRRPAGHRCCSSTTAIRSRPCPIRTACARGLEREDLFTVVHEQVMTDTARYADVVLPATTFLEHYDIAKGYGAYHLQLVQPVIDAVGESRPNHEVFRELGVRLGLSNGRRPAARRARCWTSRRGSRRPSARRSSRARPPTRRRWQPDPVRGRDAEDGGRTHPPLPGVDRAGGAQRVCTLTSRTRRPRSIPLSADLAGERAHDLVDAWRAPAAASRALQDPSRRRRSRARSPTATRCASSTSSARCSAKPRDARGAGPARCRCRRACGREHVQRRDGERARARQL